MNEPSELVLPLVVRIERDDPPSRTDALEAAATATLYMLTTEVDQWLPAVRRWDAERIRKVVRRARGAAWRRAVDDVPGLTVVRRSAQVRVYPPVPVDAWPRELAKLQVGGTELTDPTDPVPPAADEPLVLLAPDVTMTAGKSMAQSGHAAQLGWHASSAGAREAWRQRGFGIGVRTASPAGWARALVRGVPVVRDGGFTEVAPGTQTAAILLPW